MTRYTIGTETSDRDLTAGQVWERLSTISPRETLRYAAAGETNAQIATELAHYWTTQPGGLEAEFEDEAATALEDELDSAREAMTEEARIASRVDLNACTVGDGEPNADAEEGWCVDVEVPVVLPGGNSCVVYVTAGLWPQDWGTAEACHGCTEAMGHAWAPDGCGVDDWCPAELLVGYDSTEEIRQRAQEVEDLVADAAIAAWWAWYQNEETDADEGDEEPLLSAEEERMVAEQRERDAAQLAAYKSPEAFAAREAKYAADLKRWQAEDAAAADRDWDRAERRGHRID